MAFQWCENLATGVDIIDVQHKEIFNRLNMLLNAMDRGKGKAVVGNIVTFLTNYCIKHFDVEESLMIEHNYDDYPLQEASHTQLIKDLFALKKRFERDGANLHLAVQTVQWLGDTLINHIRVEDKKLGEIKYGSRNCFPV